MESEKITNLTWDQWSQFKYVLLDRGDEIPKRIDSYRCKNMFDGQNVFHVRTPLVGDRSMKIGRLKFVGNENLIEEWKGQGFPRPKNSLQKDTGQDADGDPNATSRDPFLS